MYTTDKNNTISKVINKKFTILNPRKDAFTVDWEYKSLHNSDIIVFWFSKECDNPITLYQLGVWSSQTMIPIAIGIDPEYSQRIEVVKQMEFKGLSIVDSLEKLSSIINNFYSKFFKYEEYREDHFTTPNPDSQHLSLFRKNRKDEYRQLIFQITNPDTHIL